MSHSQNMGTTGEIRYLAGALWLLAAFCAVGMLQYYPTSNVYAQTGSAFQLTSDAFEAQGKIPTKYTCDGADISPPLSWTGIPEGTRSLVLIIDDPDAPDPASPKVTWVHWIVYNIPPTLAGLPENLETGPLPAGIAFGRNSWKKTHYGGPCPPVGRHRYFHKLYALDEVLPDPGHPTERALERIMKDRILAEAQLVGTYQRKSK